ncbi:MAG TPA: H-NS histone family protein [Ramlibacter sp.]|nr:H-NS histone family protein [Ramlibacter sp.]
MKKTYTQILDEIESLKKQAEQVRDKEVSEVIARIREAITFYNLTPGDLGFGGRASAPAKKARKVVVKGVRAKPGRKPAAGKAAERAPKFRDSEGNVWSGRGPRPRWLKDAMAGGKTMEDFAVTAA